METTALLDLIPGSRLADLALEVPDDLDAAYPTPYGVHPPIEWFTEPHHDVIPGATGLITADGRFSAYSHEWDRCHVSFTKSGECWTPPRSMTGNRMFHQSRVIADAGDGQLIDIPVGVIPLGGGHAPLDATVAQATQHYDKPERVRVWARAVETDDGCVMCGTIVPGTTYRQVALMRASALSGDWRWIPQLETMDFLGPCFVARPGLPLSLEHAAIEQALWNVQRASELGRTASGLITAVVGDVAAWEPRPAVTDNVPRSVIATAMGDAEMPADTKPCSCHSSTTEPQQLPVVLPSNRNRTAAGGTGMSFNDLRDAVDAAVSSAFGSSGAAAAYVWVRDFDVEAGAGWAVFELDRDDPITGAGTATYQVGLMVSPDGAVTVDRANVVEVETTYQPVGGAGLEAMPMVTAHAADTSAIAELRGIIDQQTATIEALSADVARMTAEKMEPADIVDELPDAPELS